MFFGEREVAKIPGHSQGHRRCFPIQSAGVVGAGTMGGGIAMVFANAGIPVLLKETDQAALDRGLRQYREELREFRQRGRFTQQFVDERMELHQPTLNLRRLSTTWTWSSKRSSKEWR